MMLLILFLCIGAVAGRRSPHAEYIEELEQSLVGTPSDVLEDAKLDVPGLLIKYGYPSEIHSVEAEDGYILEMHRIPHGRNEGSRPKQNRPVVFLMHGLLSSSADFLLLGPSTALGYILSDAGYDVWLGNARGNFYSRKHRRHNPDSLITQRFWKFSWDEIGNYDLPAMIDYVLEATGQQKVHYVGHSQGGTTFLVLNSLRPEYNEKFISFQGLAPASFFTYNEHSTFNALAPYENVLESAAFAMGVGEIFGNREFMTWFATNHCIEDSILFPLCTNTLPGITSSEYFNSTLLPLILGHTPAGASIRQVAHYGQIIRFDAFRRYDHDPIRNLINYGQLQPPNYDLSKITVPAYLHYGLKDRQVDYRDLYLLARKLPNTIGVYKVARDSFNHFDFLWASDVKEMFYDRLLEHLKLAEAQFL
ncbi:lipase 1 [Bombyx mori]|uniref:Lipase n=1 Tax=Bombyx mori TaxID=7091 RepID=A0A8R2AF96_BOMMO|nr:lipase 1 [Bombyx mori]